MIGHLDEKMHILGSRVTGGVVIRAVVQYDKVRLRFRVIWKYNGILGAP